MSRAMKILTILAAFTLVLGSVVLLIEHEPRVLASGKKALKKSLSAGPRPILQACSK
jgi:hypothetical protein